MVPIWTGEGGLGGAPSSSKGSRVRACPAPVRDPPFAHNVPFLLLFDEVTLVCRDIFSRCFIIIASLLVNGASRTTQQGGGRGGGYLILSPSSSSFLYTCLKKLLGRFNLRVFNMISPSTRHIQELWTKMATKMVETLEHRFDNYGICRKVYVSTNKEATITMKQKDRHQ